MLFQDSDTWILLKVHPNIRNNINIDGNFHRGLQAWDNFMRKSIQGQSWQVRSKLLESFNTEFTSISEIFHAKSTVLLLKAQFRS